MVAGVAVVVVVAAVVVIVIAVPAHITRASHALLDDPSFVTPSFVTHFCYTPSFVSRHL